MSKANGKPTTKRKTAKKTDSVKTDGNGRDKKGRFGEGNTYAKGNPVNSALHHFRKLVLTQTKDSDIKAVWAKLVQKAKNGEPWAIREMFDRVMGKPQQSVEISGDMTTTLAVVSEGIEKLQNRLKGTKVAGHRSVGLN